MVETALARWRQSLEDAFFEKQNRELLEKFRQQVARDGLKATLAEVSGIRSPEALETCVRLDVHPETIAALLLVPLVRVAWADGRVAAAEREAILEAARGKGVGPDGVVLLDKWLATPPGNELATVWQEYVHALIAKLTPAEAANLQEQILGLAHRVADAAGGLLGAAWRTSRTEKRVIEELASAFERPVSG